MTTLTIQSPTFVQFNGSRILAVLHESHEYVAIKPICDTLGLDWSAQLQRIKRDEVLNASMVIITIVAEDGKNREMNCLPLSMLNGWLFGVSENKVKPEIKDKLIHYKKECYVALHNHFYKTLTPAATDTITPAQQQALQQAVKAKHEKCGLIYAAIWSRFNGHFSLGSYKQLPASRFEEAVSYIEVMPGILPPEMTIGMDNHSLVRGMYPLVLELQNALPRLRHEYDAIAVEQMIAWLKDVVWNVGTIAKRLGIPTPKQKAIEVMRYGY